MAFIDVGKILCVGSKPLFFDSTVYPTWTASGSALLSAANNTLFNMVVPCTYFSGDVNLTAVMQSYKMCSSYYRGSQVADFGYFYANSFRPDVMLKDVVFSANMNFIKSSYSNTDRVIKASAGFPYLFLDSVGSGFTGSPSSYFYTPPSNLSATNVASSYMATALPNSGKTASADINVLYTAKNARFNPLALSGESPYDTSATVLENPFWTQVSAYPTSNTNVSATLTWSASGRVLI